MRLRRIGVEFRSFLGKTATSFLMKHCLVIPYEASLLRIPYEAPYLRIPYEAPYLRIPDEAPFLCIPYEAPFFPTKHLFYVIPDEAKRRSGISLEL